MNNIQQILLFVFCLGISKADIYDNSYAIVIGIDKYEHVRQLNYAVKDAKSIQEILEETFDFPSENITLLTDKEATRENILNSFFEITENVRENDRVLIFFAGHGETMDLDEGGEKGYLLPVDGDRERLYLTSIPMDELKNIALMTKAKHLLYLVDACYGGIATVGSRGIQESTSSQYIEKISKNKARQIITAGGRGEKVIEKPEWGHSAFTINLKRGLIDGNADVNFDGYITANELGVFLQEKVTVDSDNQQTPQYGRMTNQEGQFIFLYPKNKIKSTAIGDSSNDEKFDLLLSEIQSLKGQINTEPMASNETTNQTSYNITTPQAIDNDTRYLIAENKLVTRKEYYELLQSDTINTDIKTEYIFMYTSDLIKKKYNLSLIGRAGYNLVDGLYLVPGIQWEPPLPNKKSIGFQGGYSFAAKRAQYQLDLEYHWIKTDNFTLNTFAKIYDKTDTYDNWREIELWNSYCNLMGCSNNYNYFRNQGFSAGLTTINYNNIKNEKSFGSLQYFHETQSPLKNSTTFSLISKEDIIDNLFHPDSVIKTKIQGVRIWIPGFNKSFNNKKCKTCIKQKQKFLYNPNIDSDSILVTLIAESNNWPKKQYEMKQVENGYEVEIDLAGGMYYYRLLIDTILITDPGTALKKVSSKGDSLSIRNVRKQLVNQYLIEFGSANADSNFNYIYLEMNLLYMYPIDPYNQLRFKFYSGGGTSPLPFSRTFYAGGRGSLRGYDINDVHESQGSIISLEYQRDFYPKFLQREGKHGYRHGHFSLFTFIDYVEAMTTDSKVTLKDMFGTSDIYRTSIGFGIELGGFRLMLAKPVKENQNEWKILLELGSFINRKYPYPE